MAGRRQNEVAGRFGLNSKAVNGSARKVRKRAGACSNPRVVADVERDFAFEHVEGLDVVPVQMERDAFAPFRLLVDQSERSCCLLPCGQEVGGCLTQPAQLALFGVGTDTRPSQRPRDLSPRSNDQAAETTLSRWAGIRECLLRRSDGRFDPSPAGVKQSPHGEAPHPHHARPRRPNSRGARLSGR
jgi:hypothetical protein